MMRTLYRAWVALSITALVALVAVPAFANAQQYVGANGSASQGNGTILANPLTDSSGHQVSSICQLLKTGLNVLLLFIVPFAMLFIVFAGARLVLARGNPEKLARAKWSLLYTLGGIALVLGVWGFVNVLTATLGALGVQALGDCR